MVRVIKELSLDLDAVERGEIYCERHRTTLSKVVSDFLLRLPVDEAEADFSATVRRLLGVARGNVDEADYHRHLIEKHGRS